jgi:hypothetical protein
VEALVALGSSLIGAVRSRDEEGAAALHEAISLAVTTGQRSLIGTAYRELGFVEFLRGRYERAELLLGESIAVSGDQPAGRATALVLLDAEYGDSRQRFGSNIRRPRPVKNEPSGRDFIRQHSWVRSLTTG